MEKKERDYADGVEIEVSSVEVQMNPKNPEQAQKVTFAAKTGNITYKPKVTKTERRNNLILKRIESCLVDDLPAFVTELATEISKNGNTKVKAYYQLWNTEQDGQPVTYRYVNGDKMMDKWEIVAPEDVSEETVK